jgi:serine/threonine protein kinase HipA of HipAB toxin-antitoxin module
MPTADATILPPAPVPGQRERHDSADERGSVRRLDEVGVEAVLGAMIEQKRRSSQPSFAAIELGTDELHDEDEGRPGGRAPTTSEVFLKAR